MEMTKDDVGRNCFFVRDRATKKTILQMVIERDGDRLIVYECKSEVSSIDFHTKNPEVVQTILYIFECVVMDNIKRLKFIQKAFENEKTELDISVDGEDMNYSDYIFTNSIMLSIM